MVVPYGDPSGGWFFRNSFDAGELGLGINASFFEGRRGLPGQLHASSMPWWPTRTAAP